MEARSAALDSVFDALANGPRRKIVIALARRPMTTPEVGRSFGFTKQALNRHVHVLERAGIISRTLHGRVHELELRSQPLEDISRWTTELRRGWASSLDRLDEILREDYD
jgi:DNA-binding transcriptional ArsR family regulator